MIRMLSCLHGSEGTAARILAQALCHPHARRPTRVPPLTCTLPRRLIASMNHKLSFLRNPRFPEPPSVKMLKSQAAQTGKTWGTSKGSGGGTMPAAKPKPPNKFDLTSRPEQVFAVEPERVSIQLGVAGRGRLSQSGPGCFAQGPWLALYVGLVGTLCGPGCHFMWAWLALCVGLVGTLWAWLALCVGLVGTLCGPGCHFMWARLALCVGLVSTLCGPG